MASKFEVKRIYAERVFNALNAGNEQNAPIKTAITKQEYSKIDLNVRRESMHALLTDLENNLNRKV